MYKQHDENNPSRNRESDRHRRDRDRRRSRSRERGSGRDRDRKRHRDDKEHKKHKSHKHDEDGERNGCSLQKEEVSDKPCEAKATSSNNDLKKVYKSSVALVPPEECWPQIQAIREKYDKSFIRWMPHINMLYPFAEDTGSNFEEASEKLKKGLSSIKPFKVVFSKSSFGYFRHKKDCALWLKPLEENPVEETPIVKEDATQGVKDEATNDELNSGENVAIAENNDDNTTVEGAASKPTDPTNLSKSQLKKQRKKALKEAQKNSNHSVGSNFRFHPDVVSLQGTLESVFPYCNDVSSISGDGFKPHLSVGQFSPKDVDKFMQEFVESWSDIEFTVSEVCLISRADFDDPFHVRYRVPLGESK